MVKRILLSLTGALALGSAAQAGPLPGAEQAFTACARGAIRSEGISYRALTGQLRPDGDFTVSFGDLRSVSEPWTHTLTKEKITSRVADDSPGSFWLFVKDLGKREEYYEQRADDGRILRRSDAFRLPVNDRSVLTSLHRKLIACISSG